MFWFKRCPRCTGDLYEDRDVYGPFITCVQCGFSRDIPNKSASLLLISAAPVPVPAVAKEEGGKRRRISHGGRHFAKTAGVKEQSITRPAA